MRKILFLVLLMGSFSSVIAQQIIPKPQHYVQYKDSLIFSSVTIDAPANLSREKQMLISYLTYKGVQTHDSFVANDVRIVMTTHAIDLPAEGYMLTISNRQISITAPREVGVFYGMQSLFQLMGIQKQRLILPNLQIKDYPSFAWRGMHLDVSRHYFPVSFIKQYIDILAMHKMNTFHWHLTDDQGWRIEIRKYPLLTQIGSKRHETMVDKNFEPYLGDGTPYEGFYTQQEIKDIVQYALDRHIQIVPEIEMPGHAVAALTAYPQFSCTTNQLSVLTSWGVSDHVFCVKDSTFRFLFDILTEVMELFPGQYIHIGGDEVPKTQWKSCAICQHTMKINRIPDEHALQSYFIRKIDSFITSKGRNSIGWDEILEGGLAPHAAVMSWRGEQGAIAAAQQHHDAVMTPGSHCYFDHYQGNKKTEPLAIGGYTPLRKTYAFNPIPKTLTTSQKKYILGAQGNLWTEYIPTPQHAMYMALPRLCALSEVVWSAHENKNYDEFVSRLLPHFSLLTDLKINYATSLFDVSANSLVHEGQLSVALQSDIQSYTIRYTLDGTEPNEQSALYTKPIPITKTTTIQAALFNQDKLVGHVWQQTYNINEATANLPSLSVKPHASYASGGAKTLCDGIVGGLPWTGNEWLGWLGDTVSVVLPVKSKQLKALRIFFLHEPPSWIHRPVFVDIFSSTDGKAFTLLSHLSEADIRSIMNQDNIFYKGSTSTAYLKIVAAAQPNIPAGFTGAGEKAWLFCSEIQINP